MTKFKYYEVIDTKGDSEALRQNLQEMLTDMKSTATADEVLRRAVRDLPNPKAVRFWILSATMDFGMRLIAITMTTAGAKQCRLTSATGAFSFVYNVDNPEFSELGYTFYKKLGDSVIRIG